MPHFRWLPHRFWTLDHIFATIWSWSGSEVFYYCTEHIFNVTKLFNDIIYFVVLFVLAELFGIVEHVLDI